MNATYGLFLYIETIPEYQVLYGLSPRLPAAHHRSRLIPAVTPPPAFGLSRLSARCCAAVFKDEKALL